MHRAKRQELHETGPKDEAGFYIVLFAIMLLSLITLIGLVVDSGNMSLDALIAQRAADAAALSGASLVDDVSAAKVVELARNVALDNLDQNRVAFDDADIQVVFDAGQKTVEANVKVKSNTFIMGKFNPDIQQRKLPRSGKAVKRPLAVVLVADKSSSMLCRAVGDPEPCDRYVGSRIEAMAAAGQKFISSINENDDALSIVLFAAHKEVLFPMTHPFVAEDVLRQMTSVQTENRTNLYAGIKEAENQMEELKIILNDPAAYANFVKIIVVITDGSPTRSSMRFRDFPRSCLRYLTYRDFIAPVLAADDIREKGIFVYTIGVGEPDPANPTSPWQGGTNLDYAGHLKTYLLKRIANDPGAATGDPAFPSPCIPKFTDILTQPKGEYQTSLDANDLTAMLNRVWRSLQLRLVQ